MRRIFLLVVIGAALLSLNAGIASAATFTQCFGGFCEGFGKKEVINESPFNDTIFSHGQTARINADRFGGDRDVVRGGRGRDRITVRDFDSLDSVRCGGGRDTVRADFGDAVNRHSCERIRRF